MSAEGLSEIAKYRSAGFTEDELAGYEADKRQSLKSAGFSPQEVDEYFGIKTPDMTPTRNYVETNFKNAEAAEAAKAKPSKEGVPPGPRTAKTIWEDMEDGVKAGFGLSVTGLLVNQKMPDLTTPENASMAFGIASQVGTLVGDAPAMLAGMISGGAEGAIAAAPLAVVPGIGAAVEAAGTAVGASAGAFAVPAGMRKLLMDHYQKGDVKDFRDFWERASGAFLEAGKGALTGVATAATGGVASNAARYAGPLVRTATVGASEVAAMTTVGAALDGHMPAPKDFIEGGVLVGGMHMIAHVPQIVGKMRGIYAETGIKPQEVVLEAEKNPVLKEQLLSKESGIPAVYEGMKDSKTELANTLQVEPAKEANLSESDKVVLSQIGEAADKPKKSYGLNELYRDMVDKYDPLKRLVDASETAPLADKDVYKLARMYQAYGAKVKHVVEKGTFDFKTLEINGKGLDSILKPFEGDVQGLKSFLISSRALELESRGIEHGIDIEHSKTVVAAGKERYGAAATDLVDFQNRLLKYVTDSGLISKEAEAKMLSSNKAYIPFFRVFENGETSVRSRSKVTTAIEGSDAKIVDPLLSIISNAEHYIKRAEKNRLDVALIEMIDKQNIPGSKVEVPLSKTKLTKEQTKLLKEHGLELSESDLMALRDVPLKEGEVSAWVNGKREIRRVDPEIASIIDSVGNVPKVNELAAKIVSVFSVPAKTLRLGATLAGEFMAKNFFRDQLMAASVSHDRLIPFVDAGMAVGKIMKKSEAYYEWMRSGGLSNTSVEIERSYLNNDIYGLNKETGFIDSVRNGTGKIVDKVVLMNELIEQSTRMAAFDKHLKGKEKNAANIIQAGFESREVTLDFSRMGAKMQALNAITAFQNASIQGIDKSVRMWKEKPLGTAGRVAAMITAPSLLLWYLNHNDERYKELPQWQKDLFWNIITDDWQPHDPTDKTNYPEYLLRSIDGVKYVNKGTIYRLPKPQELGLIFGTIPERLAESFFTDNPHAFKELGSTIFDAATPPILPNAAKPFYEHYNEKSTFTKRSIIPQQLEGLLPDLQAAEYTSQFARELGKIIQPFPGMNNPNSFASPANIDNYIQNWTGTLGKYAVQIMDKALEKAGVVPEAVRPDDTLADIPVIKAFVVRYPSGGAKSIQDFYDNYKESQTIIKSLKEYEKANNEAGINMIMDEHSESLIKLDDTKKAMGEISGFIRMVNKDPKMTPTDKRQLIDGAYYEMIEIAKSANTVVEDIKRSKKLK